MKSLEGKVALVAGATRGAGRGVARMLGEAGATVYCTGRSSRTQPNTSDHHYAGRPETIEETSEMVDAAGGVGIPVRVDHNVESEVEQLLTRVGGEQGRLDVLVNVLTGRPVTSWQPFWKASVSAGRELIDSWVWSHATTCRYAIPLMVEQKKGLIVEVLESPNLAYHGELYFDMFEIMLKRLAYSLAEQLAPQGVAVVTVAPHFLRTEAILEHYGVTEENWREAVEKNAEARNYGFANSETPCFVGRGIAALAADPEVMRFTGGMYGSWTLAEEYGFTDVDGERPDLRRDVPAAPKTASGRLWTVSTN